MIISLLNGLKKKKHRVIERYLKLPFMKTVLQKYFSLKFAIYYQELSTDGMDGATIIQVLNEQMNHSDIKIVLYEMNNRIMGGEALENILKGFEYFDVLFITFFKCIFKIPININLSRIIFN